MKMARASVDMSIVYRAYAQLGDRVAKNLVKRSLREALIPVRELQRGAWMSASFRSGRSKREGLKHTRAMRKKMRARGTRPVVVRNAVRRAITVKVDRTSKGVFTAAVGVDYAKRGLKGQQRLVHIIEGGRASRPIQPKELGRRVNQQQQGLSEQRFLEAMRKGIENGG
jgi:hypothetical protein